MLRLNNLKPAQGSNKKTKRIGRGEASGQGTQAGKGHKGQKARAGGGVRTGFEGGGMPLYMRLPKRGFTNSNFKREYAEVTISLLNIIGNKLSDAIVSKESLVQYGAIKGRNKRLPVKILGNDTVKLKFKVVGIDKITKGAQKALTSAGCEIS